MAKKTVKKVDFKKVTKLEVSNLISDMLQGVKGVSVHDGKDFGFTEGTLVLRGEKCDVQIKLITPKAGVDRYESLVEEEDTDTEEVEEVVEEVEAVEEEEE